MTEFLPTIISVLSGAAAANLAGLAFRKFSLGYIMNTITGAIGGVVGSIAANSWAGTTGNPAVLNGVLWGGIGGGVLLLIAGAIRNVVKK